MREKTELWASLHYLDLGVQPFDSVTQCIIHNTYPRESCKDFLKITKKEKNPHFFKVFFLIIYICIYI